MRGIDALRPGFALAGQPRRLSPHEPFRRRHPRWWPSDSHLCKTNQHFVYLKSQNEVI